MNSLTPAISFLTPDQLNRQERGQVDGGGVVISVALYTLALYSRKLNPRKLCDRHSAKVLLLENFLLYGIDCSLYDHIMMAQPHSIDIEALCSSAHINFEIP